MHNPKEHISTLHDRHIRGPMEYIEIIPSPYRSATGPPLPTIYGPEISFIVKGIICERFQTFLWGSIPAIPTINAFFYTFVLRSSKVDYCQLFKKMHTLCIKMHDIIFMAQAQSTLIFRSYNKDIRKLKSIIIVITCNLK